MLSLSQPLIYFFNIYRLVTIPPFFVISVMSVFMYNSPMDYFHFQVVILIEYKYNFQRGGIDKRRKKGLKYDGRWKKHIKSKTMDPISH